MHLLDVGVWAGGPRRSTEKEGEEEEQEREEEEEHESFTQLPLCLHRAWTEGEVESHGSEDCVQVYPPGRAQLFHSQGH